MRGLPTGLAYNNSNPSRRVKENFALVRYDYTISGADSLSMNISTSRGLLNDPSQDPLFRSNDRRDLYTAGMQHTHVFSPSVLNTLTFGFSQRPRQQPG